jgi:hypothetical protein
MTSEAKLTIRSCGDDLVIMLENMVLKSKSQVCNGTPPNLNDVQVHKQNSRHCNQDCVTLNGSGSVIFETEKK